MIIIKRLIYLTSILLFFVSSQSVTSIPKVNSFGKGEELSYRIKFGVFTVAKATTRISKELVTINSTPCYKVEAFGETLSWVSIIKPVKDNFGTFLDTTHLSTQMAFRKLREGGHKLDEITTFDHAKGKAEVKVMNNETGIYDDKKTFEVNEKATDLVGGFMLLRQIDFSILHKNDTLALDGFLEDKVYHLKMIYMGIESVSTKVGRVPCHKLIPIMPDNKLFDGENSITVWISNDLNKIPVKMQAKMFIGYTGVELEQFRGLKHQLKIEASH